MIEVIIIDRGSRGHVGVSTSLSDQDVVVFGLPKFRETIATTSWYLWWEHRKVTHGEEVQDADQINMAVRALAANFVLAWAPKAGQNHEVDMFNSTWMLVLMLTHLRAPLELYYVIIMGN